MKTPETKPPRPGKAFAYRWKKIITILYRRLRKLMHGQHLTAAIKGSKAFSVSGESPPRQEGKDFYHQLLAKVEENISDPTFTAEELSRQLYMSYSTCLRKVKAATGMAVKEYIRYVRINRAAWLLEKQPERNISNIAQDVGFTSGTYFSREFRKIMGCSPTTYRKREREQK